MSCYNTRVVPAPIGDVWKALRNFHDMSWAAGVIDKLEPVGKLASDQIGARRILNGVFHETLHALDDKNHEIRYTIDAGPDALAPENVTDYVGQVRVFPVTDRGHTFVEWSSRWQDSKGGVKEFCDPIYNALLNALVTRFS